MHLLPPILCIILLIYITDIKGVVAVTTRQEAVTALDEIKLRYIKQQANDIRFI